MKTSIFAIEGLDGAKTLRGEIAVAGAKNAALKAMAAALLFSDKVVVENVPAIEDVNRMVELLEGLGAAVTRDVNAKRLSITAPADTDGTLGESAKRMRASIVLTGPLLARYGRVTLPHPGGCVIGPRPIDQFLRAYEKMGATVSCEDAQYVISAPRGGLVGADIFFTTTSHTATETVMMAAVRAHGTTRIQNAAMDPEIVALAEFINASGGKVAGAGTPSITIEGVPALAARGAAYRTIPDRIEAGSFVILGALAASELTVRNCVPEHIAILIELLREVGADLSVGADSVTVRGKSVYRAVNVRTQWYPGFATDLQAPMTVFLTQASGASRVFETIFDERLTYTEDLVRMGADITLWNRHEIEVRGPCRLRGKDLEAPDIRAGLAFIIAALIAKGRSTIGNAYYIDRGYEHIDKRLRQLGASISRA